VRSASDGVPAVPDAVGPDLPAAAGSGARRGGRGADDLAVHDLPDLLGVPGDLSARRLLTTT
jgi:hypothetical protein